MGGFVKLHSSILRSTIWLARPDRDVFLTALLLAEPHELTEDTPQLHCDRLEETGWMVPAGWYGFCEASGPGIVHQSGTDALEGIEALRRLGEPEPSSRSQVFAGRRVVRVDHGYIVLNYMEYREKDCTNAERQRRYRERKSNGMVTSRNGVTRSSVTQAEAEAEAEAEADAVVGGLTASVAFSPKRRNRSTSTIARVTRSEAAVTALEGEVGSEVSVGSGQLDLSAARPTLAKGEERAQLPATAPPPLKPARKDADPRFAPLRAAFESEFMELTGQSYRWQGAKDATALHRLLAVPLEEFRQKAKAGLRANGFVRSPTVAQLAAKWNDLTAATVPTTPAKDETGLLLNRDGTPSLNQPARPRSAFRRRIIQGDDILRLGEGDPNLGLVVNGEADVRAKTNQ